MNCSAHISLKLNDNKWEGIVSNHIICILFYSFHNHFACSQKREAKKKKRKRWVFSDSSTTTTTKERERERKKKNNEMRE